MSDDAREELLKLCETALSLDYRSQWEVHVIARALRNRLVRELAEDSVPIPVGLPRQNK